MLLFFRAHQKRRNAWRNLAPDLLEDTQVVNVHHAFFLLKADVLKNDMLREKDPFAFANMALNFSFCRMAHCLAIFDHIN